MEINLSVKQANKKRGNTETAWIKLSNLGAQSGLQRKGETSLRGLNVTPGEPKPTATQGTARLESLSTVSLSPWRKF